ncbi:MAG: amino acid permease [Candidatus Omnitrophica bacterium]|nr:amino acid permease [Candidatus Omnitrophota bacterium]
MERGLRKELTLLDVFCIATGAMISSGLFILPGLAHAQAGPAVVFSYFLAGLLALTGMLSQAELVSAMPKTGGTYFYVTRSMGPAAGTIDGLITWFSLSLKTAFALIGMAAFTKILVAVEMHIIAVILCSVFVLINIIGIKEAGRVQRFLVFSLLLILGFYIVRGIPAVNVDNFKPFFSKGVASVFSTAGFVFISFGGLLKVASVAEEVKNPERTIPIGMILSLFVVTVFYTLVVFVTSGVLGATALDHSLTPISDGARIFLGANGVRLLNIAAILAFISTANAGIMAASRYPTALARDGLLPEVFGIINKRYKTPHIAIIFTGIIIIIALFFNLTVLVKMASTVLISTFLFSCLAVIIMRESKVQNYQPKFRSPLYPWVQILGMIGCGLLIFEMGKASLIAFGIFIIGGLFIYWFYGRIRVTREYALLHLIERITAKEITSHLLETELKEIIQARDDIAKDRFDAIVEKGAVLDIDQEMPLEDFFKLAAKILSKRVGIQESVFFRLICDREKETSTAITPDIAMPHIIIDGEQLFDILLVRCKEGIKFSDDAPNIHTVFVLVGTRDERNFHLRALAAIAQIVQNPSFEKKWMSAKNEKALKDVVLLGKRMR